MPSSASPTNFRAWLSGKPFPALPQLGAAAFAGLFFLVGMDDAEPASLGGAVSSVGMFAALATLFVVRGWQSHLGAEGMSAFAGVLALTTGAALLWNSGPGSSLREKAVRSLRRRVRTNSPAASLRRAIDLPAGIERQALLGDLCRHFFALQSAWDTGARDAITRLTTPDMLDELCAASAAGNDDTQRTEFLTLNASLMLFEERDAAQVVCVEYSGMVREAPGRAAAPFREVWMLTRSAKAPSEWRLARHQGLL